MSCGDNPEASMSSDEGSGTPDERQRNLASLNLRELAGELSLLAHAAATGERYDAESTGQSCLGCDSRGKLEC
eukprot:4893458-Pleurochrysis_carterae.AAC.1